MQDDNSLMELVKNGDKEAYNEIVRRHRAAAISFAYSFFLDIHAAEDIVQDVFVNIYVKRDSYKPVCGFKTFLFRAVRNKSIDYLRRMKLRKTVDINDIAESATELTGKLISRSPEDEFIQDEKIKFIFDLMNGLKDNYRTALYLFAVEGASYDEIAGIMKKSMAQVKILIYRARKKIKSQYAEVYGNEI